MAICILSVNERKKYTRSGRWNENKKWRWGYIYFVCECEKKEENIHDLEDEIKKIEDDMLSWNGQNIQSMAKRCLWLNEMALL